MSGTGWCMRTMRLSLSLLRFSVLLICLLGVFNQQVFQPSYVLNPPGGLGFPEPAASAEEATKQQNITSKAVPKKISLPVEIATPAPDRQNTMRTALPANSSLPLELETAAAMKAAERQNTVTTPAASVANNISLPLKAGTATEEATQQLNTSATAVPLPIATPLVEEVPDHSNTSASRSRVLEEGLGRFLERWPAVRLEHHNLDPSEMVHYNITCKPKVWLLLSSLYRSMKFVRPTMVEMLRRSAGDCWFVTLLASSETGMQRETLEDDFRFFEGRFGFLSVTRHGKALKKKYMFPAHWYGCWLIAHVLRESMPESLADDPGSTVVVRHRPDECFRQCFDADAAGEILAQWRYLIFGQPVSGDNGLTTNWLTYTDIIAAGFIRSKTVDPVSYMAAWTSSWSRHEYCHGMVYPWECQGEIPYCRVNGNVPPCRPPIFISWEQHCLCRLHDNQSSAWCIDSEAPDRPVERQCVQLTKVARCILPLDGPDVLPPALRPPKEQLQGGLHTIQSRFHWYMYPKSGMQECLKGRDLNKTA